MSKVFIFNPGSEETWHLPAMSSYTPPRLVQRMMEDLSPMLRVLGNPGDVVYVPGEKEPLYLECGITARDFVNDTYLPNPSLHSILPIELDFWAPQLCAQQTFVRTISKVFGQVKYSERPSHLKELVHRRTAARLMSYLSQRLHLPEYLTAQEIESLDDLPRIVELLGHKLIAKIPFSSSGRGVFPFDYPLRAEDETLLSNLLKRGSSLMVEKRLPIKQDFATEWKIVDGKCCFLGYSYFQTTQGGSYTGNVLMSQEQIKDSLFYGLPKCSGDKILDVSKDFIQEHIAPYYEGYLGIDALIYYDEKGNLSCYPAVEINLRKTMGYLAIELYNRLIAKGCKASFVVAPGIFDNLDPEFDDSGRLKRGRLNIGSNLSNRSFSAYIEII